MGKKNECYLCGAKLQRGYCKECGLDNTKIRRKNYRLNESISISSINGKTVSRHHARSSKPTVSGFAKSNAKAVTLNEYVKKPTVSKVKQMDAQASKHAEQNTSVPLNFIAASPSRDRSYQFVPQKNSKTDLKGVMKKANKNTRSNNRFVIRTIVIFIAVIVGGVRMIGTYYEDYSYQTVYDEAEIIEYDPYEVVTRELSAEGDELVQIVDAGEYVVGTHIPEGNYTITLVEGNGYFSLGDYENGIYLWQSFGENEEYDEVLELHDMRLYQNARFSISEGVVLEFTTSCAQTDAVSYIENPLTEEIDVEEGESLLAGIDFPAGIYDAMYVEEEVWVIYSIPANPQWYEEGYVENSIWLDKNAGSQKYSNLVLPEGTEITTEDGGLLLIPSERIYSVDYDSYYDYYEYGSNL